MSTTSTWRTPRCIAELPPLPAWAAPGPDIPTSAEEHYLLSDVPPFPCVVPDGAKGAAAISSFTLTHKEFFMDNLRAMRDGLRVTCASPGRYKRLVVEGALVMSNTPFEARTNQWITAKATGSALITGLGLGVVPWLLLRKPGIERITVVEVSQDVIDLVAPHIADPRLEVICADAYTWAPPKGQTWTWGWHDIWSDFGGDGTTDRGRLKRRFARRITGEQRAWVEDLCAGLRRRGW